MSEGLRCTPGPWRIGYTRAFDAEGEYGHTLNLIVGDRIIPLTSARLDYCPDDYEEWKANAHAMKAAPDMLRMLIRVTRHLDIASHNASHAAKTDSRWDGVHETLQPLIREARAIIERAKGEAP